MSHATGFYPLAIDAEHIYAVKNLTRPEGAPSHHEPFDRLLIAQAKVEGLTLLTHDATLAHYSEVYRLGKATLRNGAAG